MTELVLVPVLIGSALPLISVFFFVKIVMPIVLRQVASIDVKPEVVAEPDDEPDVHDDIHASLTDDLFARHWAALVGPGIRNHMREKECVHGDVVAVFVEPHGENTRVTLYYHPRSVVLPKSMFVDDAIHKYGDMMKNVEALLEH